MNKEPKLSVAHASMRRGLSVALLASAALVAYAATADAASFRCPHHASASERLVCNDPTLSALDDKLAALYRAALDATPNAEALEADRIAQWQWRQHNCKDSACVTDWYNRRIAELEGDLSQGNAAAVQRVKDSVVDQHLVPSAQQAVLQMKGICAAADKHAADNDAASAANAPLHLRKMPSGIAADARQQRLAAQADAHAHALAHGGTAPVAASAVPAANGPAAAEAARTDDTLNQPGAEAVK